MWDLNLSDGPNTTLLLYNLYNSTIISHCLLAVEKEPVKLNR